MYIYVCITYIHVRRYIYIYINKYKYICQYIDIYICIVSIKRSLNGVVMEADMQCISICLQMMLDGVAKGNFCLFYATHVADKLCPCTKPGGT